MADATAPAAAFDSGLTTPDFAACLSMGLQPLRLAQGFYCGQMAAWSGYQAAVIERYPCGGHYDTNHAPPGWLGQHDAVDEAWTTAFDTAMQRLRQEAEAVGAHGVVGVHVELGHPTNEHSTEVHLYGTAVRVAGASAGPIWTTRIAGHKLAKLIEAGYVPDDVLYARCTGISYEGCYGEHYGPNLVPAGSAFTPVEEVHRMARQRALEDARRKTGRHSLYGVEVRVYETESGDTTYVTCQVLGSVVRRVRPTMPLAVPVATVSLHD
jgi:hypothetical protein